MIDLYFRAFSRARWDTFAENRGITVAGIVQPGFYIDHIGNVQLTDAVIVDGVVVTPPTFDTWHCVNFRAVGKRFEDDQGPIYPGETDPPNYTLRFLRSQVVNSHRDQATVINLPFRGDTIRAYQIGSGDNRLQLLDPRDIVNYKPREWLGGMSW